MTLAVGARLGPYEVMGLLGAGGMGEVYRARDPHLGREVALKVLPERFGTSPGRLERLRREAKLLASLNHPHIATLYGLEEADGRPVLVMEVVEGQTLSERLHRGTLAVPEALECASQIAEALEAAHEKGILHRDLKPANVRVSEKGHVKLLDFGLARAVVDGGSGEGTIEHPSSLPTEESPASPSTGVVGTAPYMSPEQARGEEVDRRADVWAFGCVVFELLSGRRAFGGSTPAEATAAVLGKDPPWSALPEQTPPAIRRLLERCLQKERARRLRDIGDARLEIEELLRGWRRGGRLGPEERSPYPGLRFFSEEDAGSFFGREAEVAALWEKLGERHLLAVVGPSGVGKTSFVRAGVVASRPEGWGALVCTPGSRPFAALAHALAPHLAGDAPAVSDLLRIEELERALAALSRWRSAYAEALLVVDQLEELFTLNPPEVQERFSVLLARIASEADVHVLLSMRDDFLMRCHEHRALAPVFRELTPVGALDATALERAVVEPARKRGYAFDDETLIEEMVSSVEGVRGALPLLAFAVARLWEKREREKKLLTRAAYEEIAGVEGALAQHAEATIDRIGTERQGVVREIFRHLVTAQGTRAVMDRDELLSAFPERQEAEEVLGELIDARLLTSYEVEDAVRRAERGDSRQVPAGVASDASSALASGPHRVEIVHESLLTAWPRLVRWETQDQDSAQLRDQLKQAAHLWDERNRTPDLLWSGMAFREHELWRERYTGRLTAVEEAFSRSMVERAHRRRRVRRLVAASIVAAAVSVAIVTSILWRRSDSALQRAETEARHRAAAEVLALGRLRLEGHPTAALAHALASLERADNDPARRFAVEALWRGPMAHVVADAINPVTSSWSPDGRWLALGGTQGLIVLDQDGGRHPLLDGEHVLPVGFSADSSRLVTRVAPGVLQVWSLPDFRRLDTWASTGASRLRDRRLLIIRPDREGHEPPLLLERSIDGGPERILGRWPKGDFSDSGWQPRGDIGPRGDWIFWIEDGDVRRRRLEAKDSRAGTVGRHDGGWAVWSLATADRIATADRTGGIRLWDPATGRLVRTLQSPVGRFGVALDPSGRHFAVGPTNADFKPGSLRVLDLEGPGSADPAMLLNDDLIWQNSMRFSTDGRLLASCHFPHGLLLWNLVSQRSIVLRGQKGPLVAVEFTPDGRLVSTSDEGVVRLWPLWTDPADRVRELWSQPGRERLACGPAVSPDGQFAVVCERYASQVIVLPLDGSEGTVHQTTGSLDLVALHPDGRHLAVMVFDYGKPESASIRIFDLETREVRTLRVEDTTGACTINSPSLGPIQVPIWLSDGRLVTEGALGLRLWDLADGSARQLRPCRESRAAIPSLRATPDSSTVVTLFDARPVGSEVSTLTTFDLTTGESHGITEHGLRLSAFALDPTGRVLVTGDSDGLVRVGPLAGGEPHLLYGHSRGINSIAVSPDGRWIASAGDDETIRLWPMPDTSKPPLHVWPYAELVEKLRSFTNLRVVPDPESDSGYKLEPGPFAGWREVPIW